MPRIARVVINLAAVILFGNLVAASDWERFRGPNGTGVSEGESTYPSFWDDSANLQWKCELPGRGSSSPIVIGDNVFVTSWSGYGLSREEPGDLNNLMLHLSCIDRNTGQILWDKTVKPYLPEEEYAGMFAEHGYASHSPVSDGKRVFVYFGKTGAVAFDMEGNQLWQRQVGTESDPRGWGSASSPILYENLMIVTASAESEAIVALDKATGREVWRQEATKLGGVWGTPLLVETDNGQTDLVIAVIGEIWGLNPDTGMLRWYCAAPQTSSFCSSAIAHDGIVYAMETGPGGGGGIAVKAGGEGDVTDTHVLWTGQQSNRIGTPLFVNDKIYTFSRGVAVCFDAENGDRIYRGRLKSSGPAARGGRAGQDYSSPVYADGKIYFTSRGGDIYVLQEGDTFNQLAVNRVAGVAEDFSATPAVSDGQIFVRSDKNLYCIAQLAEGQQQQRVARANQVDSESVAQVEEPEDRPRRRGRFDPASFFAERDTDGDGKLSGDEIQGRLRDRIDQLDSDKDGAITLEEFRGAIGRAFGRRGRRGGRGNREAGEHRPERPERPPLEGAAT